MSDMEIFFVALTTCTAVGVVVGTQCYLWRWRSKRRIQNLEVVYTALNDHYDAAAYIIDDPAASDGLKRLILEFSEALDDRGVANRFVASFGDKDWKSDNHSDESKEIEELERTRPDLAEAFRKCVATGVIALTLRWPETAIKFQELIAKVSANDRRDLAVARKLARLDHRPDHRGDDKLAAAAC